MYALKGQIVERQNDVPFQQWIIQFSEPTPNGIIHLAREAINNLRVSLDHMVCDLARLSGGNIDKAKFPFARDKKNVIEVLKGIKLHSNTAQYLYDINPLNAPNQWLRDLHDLDIIWKHRFLMPLLGVAKGQVPLPIPWQQQIFGGEIVAPWSHGSELWLPDGEDPVPQLRLTGEMTVTLPRGVPFGGEEIPMLITNLAGGIEGIIKTFDHGYKEWDGVE